ncbi:MAG: hypothetical protein FJ096_21860 [Deltaproteobacteria bacterium]|nr:hypothetical protein [Deltaproteobacteria bacterium]
MWARSLGAALVVLTSATALAAGGGAEAVQRAADHFDEGARSFQARRYEEAASHFEAAYAAIPNARALRNAMRSRDAASQPARSATLAALALARYSDDPETTKIANELLARHAQSLAYLNVRCSSPCLMAVNGLALLSGVDAQHSIYVKPGVVKLVASFAKGGEGEDSLEVRAGATVDLELSPKPEEAGAAQPRPTGRSTPVEAPRVEPTSTRPEAEPRRPRRTEPEAGSSRAGGASEVSEDSPWYRSRGLFVTAVVATAGVGGVTAWSGIDTLRNPGRDAVRQACAGLGTSCPEYQRGLASQQRTNILIGTTAGAGLATLLIGSLLTDFSGGEKTPVSVSLAAGSVGFGVGLDGSF